MVPHDWTTARLGELIQEGRHIRYGVVQPGHLVMSGCLMLRSQDYSKGWRGADGMHRVSVQLEAQYKNAKLKAKDLVMTVVGAGIGQVESVPNWLEGAVLSRSTARIAIDNKKAEPLFIKYFLESPATQKQLLDCQKEGAQPVVSCPDLALFRMHCPPIEEQKLIAGALEKIDDLISSLDQLIAKKRDIQQAAMQQLLTGQRRLPGFSEEWKDGKFRDVVRSLSAGVSVNSTDDLPEPGLPCVLKTSALSDGHFFPNEAKAIVAADRARACTNPKKNTILISRMNTPALVGEIAYVEKDYDWLFLPDRLWMTQLMSDDCVNVRWLSYLLSSSPYRKLLQDSATGTSGSMKNISKGVLLNLQISYPIIEEQTAIAIILSDMDTELAALEARRDKARQLKQGMMQELLTGRIRLV